MTIFEMIWMIWKNEFLKWFEWFEKKWIFEKIWIDLKKVVLCIEMQNFIWKTENSEVSDQLDVLHKPVCLKLYQIR